MIRRRRSGSDRAPPDADEARRYALRALGRREHGARELAHKLARTGLAEAEADSIVETLAADGWQSDTRFSELLIRSRVAQGYGPLRIRAELAAKGVDEALISGALSAVEFDWAVRLRQLYTRRYPEAPASAKERASRYRFLAGRGFTSEQIRSALKTSEFDEYES